ncbi:MAG: hypothetical protein A3F72_07995 [Bacteroidetes bacterium RIFCSPLOWO2_12_FULL_35_15]|nr:MAG: hypothetical protein A3F72_07995 [Bacteroidetes bacterium RIFCSPLOWO2_12_FULL_35_15]
MQKNILIFLLLLPYSKILFSQNDAEYITPIHYVRVDVVKGIAGKIELNYERFNGKKGGLKLGLGVYFPYHYSYIIPGGSSVFNGYSFDIQRKCYIHFKYTSIYLAPKFIYTYKECSNKEIYEGGGGSSGTSSSYAMWDWITEKMNSYSAVGTVGFHPKIRRGFNIDVSFGLGASVNDVNRTITPQRYTTSLKSGHFIEYSPKIQLGIALGFGVEGESK